MEKTNYTEKMIEDMQRQIAHSGYVWGKGEAKNFPIKNNFLNNKYLLDSYCV